METAVTFTRKGIVNDVPLELYKKFLSWVNSRKEGYHYIPNIPDKHLFIESLILMIIWEDDFDNGYSITIEPSKNEDERPLEHYFPTSFKKEKITN